MVLSRVDGLFLKHGTFSLFLEMCFMEDYFVCDSMVDREREE